MIKIKKYQIEDYISDATQDALDLKADLVDGKVPASQLPSFVDDVIEVANYAALPIPGATGVIYITLDTNKVYRWTGSVYVEIASGVTNLSYTPGVSDGTVNSDTGTDATIPLAGVTNAGLFSAAEKTKLGGIAAGANVGVVPNAPITGATKTKITYDSKGLVTAGADATTADIADSTNKRYVTDANLVVIGNTSGTNTGDQNLQQVTDDGATTTNSITANSFIKSGGTSSQILAADGSVITAGTNITISGGTISSTSSSGGIPHATASGTDTYTATVTGVISYADGDAYLIRFTNGNTTVATLNINALGAIPLYKNNDGPLIGGDVQSNGEMLCVYNSTANTFQCIGTSPNSIISYVTNAEAVTITKGQVVYAFGGTGDRMTVKLASNIGDSTSAQTVGIVLSTSIAANQKGFIIFQGLLDNLSTLPTATWADGDPVYLGVTAGSITKTKPYAPNHLVYIGIVTTASNGAAGRMYVRVQNGYELDELHNVQAQTPTLKDTLWYDNTVSPAQWKTASISSILGYTPANDANVVHIAGTETITGAKTFSSQTILGDGIIGTPTYGLTPQATVGSTTGGVFDIRNTNTNIVAGNTIGTLQFSAKDDGSVAYTTAQIKAITQNGIGTGSSGKTDLIFYTSNGSTPVEIVKINDLGLVINSEVIQTIASFDVNKSIKSLSTTTYPSLTELALLKGVTGSSVQTQLNGKQNTITLSAIGAVPNANAATLTGSVLNLQPASASFGGVVTTGTQTFAGQKTFSSISFGATGLPTFFEYFGTPFLTVGPGVTFSIGGGPGPAQNNLAVPNGTFNIGLQTASTIASFDASKNVVSLPTATYPNLTELALLKGVTGSSVQTQLNGKQNTITLTTTGSSGAATLIGSTLNIPQYSGGSSAQSAFTILANNTASSAVPTEQNFRSVAQQSYTNTITWTGTAPTGGTNSYSWFRIGNVVTVRLNLVYSAAGGSITAASCPLPSDCPTPLVPSGLGSSGHVLYCGSGNLQALATVPLGQAATLSCLRINLAGSGYDLYIARSSGGYSVGYITVTYFTS